MITLEFIRSFRVGGYAIFDFVVSFIGIYLLAPFLSLLFSKLNIRISRKSWLFLTVPLSVVFHLLFGSYTQLTKDVIDMGGHYSLKLLLITLLILGLKDVRRMKLPKDK